MADIQTHVLYMSSSFWLLGDESRDFSDMIFLKLRKKELLAKLSKFTQNDNLGPFLVKIVVILWILSALQAVLSYSAWENSRESTPNSQKLEDM